MTNEEWLKSSSTEALAEILTRAAEYIDEGGCTRWSSYDDCDLDFEEALVKWEKWLKKEREDDK